jgi:hypothetical protein
MFRLPNLLARSVLISVALVGGVVVVGGALAAVALISLQTYTGEELLPADATIIVLQGDDANLAALALRIAPGLNDAPMPRKDELTALLRLPGNTLEWVRLPRGDVTRDAPGIQASPAALELLFSKRRSIIEVPAYRALRTAAPAADTLFLRTEWLRTSGNPHPFVLSALTGRTTLALARQDNTWLLATDGDTPRAQLAGEALPAPPNTIADLRTADATNLLATLRAWQQPDARTITDGLARATTERWLGPQSQTGSGLDLLRQLRQLQIVEVGSGTTATRLFGTLPSDANQALLNLVSDNTSSTSIELRGSSDEEGFDTRRLALASSQARLTTTNATGWQISPIGRLTSATRNGDVLLTTETAVITWPSPAPTNDGTTLTATIDADALQSHVPPSLPALLTRAFITTWPTGTWQLSLRYEAGAWVFSAQQAS